MISCALFHRKWCPVHSYFFTIFAPQDFVCMHVHVLAHARLGRKGGAHAHTRFSNYDMVNMNLKASWPSTSAPE